MHWSLMLLLILLTMSTNIHFMYMLGTKYGCVQSMDCAAQTMDCAAQTMDPYFVRAIHGLRVYTRTSEFFYFC